VPHEGPGVVVVRVEVVLDGTDEIRHRGKDATTNRLVGDLAKPALDEVEPRTRRRGEVQVKSGMLAEPVPHVGVLLGGVVVQDHVDPK
jgi:hypothetical protein